MIWLIIPGYEGRYEISDEGQVRSIERQVRTARGTRRVKARIQKLNSWGSNYPGITLVSECGKRTRFMVHMLVAKLFVPNPLGLPWVGHKDNNTWNCKKENLVWCTPSQNVKHEYDSGNREIGENHHFSKMLRDSKGRVVK